MTFRIACTTGRSKLLFRARAVRLRFHDDLMPAIDGGHARVALNDALPGGHFRALVIRAIRCAAFTIRSGSVGSVSIARCRWTMRVERACGRR